MAPTQLENQIKTNYFSTMHCAHAAINLMTTAPNKPTYPRQLVFTSSVLAFYPIAGYTSYSPAKAAIRSLADSLRQECILYDINVACCFPATIYSPGFEQEQLLKPELTKVLEGGDEGQTPDQVAEVCVKKLEEGQFLITTTFMGSLMRAASFAGSRRNNLLFDTFMAWVVNVVWWFVRPIMDMDVHKYRKTKGVPPPGSK
jgi:3-dehydrosphinganine reductase